MAVDLVIFDRVKESSVSTGTGNLALAGTSTGFRLFSDVYPDGVPFPYSIKNAANTQWEEGIGETSAGSLIRRVIASNNGDALVNFNGTLDIVVTRHAAIIGNRCWCGTGEDGALLITGTTPGNDITMTEDRHHTTIAWQAGSTARLITNGYIPHVTDHLDLTNCPAGGIVTTHDGWGTVGGGAFFGRGADSDMGFSGHLLTYAPRQGGRLGGTGGSGSGAGVANGGSGTQIGKVPHYHSITGIPGGSGGGGGYAATGFANGGRGGGVIEIRARRVTRTTGGTATAAVQADGEAGSNGASAGGGGGGGGRIRLIYGTLLGTAKTALFRVAGGIQGTGGGSSTDGDPGWVELINMRTGAHTLTVGPAVNL